MHSRNEPTSRQPPHDELDAMLRIWHEENASSAAAGREALLQRLRTPANVGVTDRSDGTVERMAKRRTTASQWSSLRAAASLGVAIGALALLMPLTSRPAMARQEVILLPEGGRLEARDDRGQVIGPCALRHTDVHAEISGPFSRVIVKQRYHNPYAYKIEAVYTFPLSHRAAVDRMTMTVGDRIIEGEVKDRQQARQMYQSARHAGHVASLLEQERPNIFTQSVANIEPNAEVLIEISYVEMLQQRDGEYTFGFPMVVAPRYIPGTPAASLSATRGVQPAQALPNELERREGVILLGPASFERLKIDMQGAIDQGNLQFNRQPIGPAPYLQRIIDDSTPILAPDGAYRQREDVQALYRANPNYDFDVRYADGTREFGQIAGDGLGHIAGRWFYFDPAILADVQRDAARDESAFAHETNQVPDANRITPIPVRPSMRAGHDISLSISINTGVGGPAIINWNSDLHEIICSDPPSYRDLGNKVNLALKNRIEIPNRDFVLRWRCADDVIRESVFAHADPKWVDDRSGKGGGGGGFFTAVIAPPARVDPEQVLPRELIFVLDTSGSMQGLPIEKAKAVMSKAIDAMRPGDTFNLITFSGDTRILWKSPRPNTETNRAAAQSFLAGHSGSGGTEMMTAINAALTPTLRATDVDVQARANILTATELVKFPSDGREVCVRVAGSDFARGARPTDFVNTWDVIRYGDNGVMNVRGFDFRSLDKQQEWILTGSWIDDDGTPWLDVRGIEKAGNQGGNGDHGKDGVEPLRIVVFLTDGLVGNDDAIISAVRENSKTTRVFSFGIGDSPNRYLLDGVAMAGRGEVTYVNLNNDPDAAVQAFARRIESPVLRDIRIAFSEGLDVFDVMPALDAGGLPDLWDVKPLIVHGRYSSAKPQTGKITITGKTATGDYTRVIDVALPAKEEAQSMLPALWARAKIDDVLARDDGIRRNGAVQSAGEESKREVIALGERYGITSPFTSFVAIEKTRITIAGRPMLVPIPIEFPSGMKWEGVFGGDACHRPADDVTRALLTRIDGLDHENSVRLITLDMARRDANATPEINRAAHDYLANVLNNMEQQKTLAENPPRFDNSPDLDLDGALNQIEPLHRFGDVAGLPMKTPADASRLYSVAGVTSYFGKESTPSAMRELGETLHLEFDQYNFVPATGDTMLALGLEGVTASDLPSVGYRYAGMDGAWNGAISPAQSLFVARGDGSPIDMAGRQLRFDAKAGKLVPVDMAGVGQGWGEYGGGAGGGGGFGGGGGGGGGAGGSIFGEAGDDPQRLISNEERSAQLIDLITETVNPEVWDAMGGDLTTVSVDHGVLNFRTLRDSQEAAHTIDRARAFVTMLSAGMPEVLGGLTLDHQPTRPFAPTDVNIASDAAPVEQDANEEERPRTVLYVYDVRDLVKAGMAIDGAYESKVIDDLVEIISTFIEPDAWNFNGGDRGSIRAISGNLIITIEPEHHRDIEALLARIRGAISKRDMSGKPEAGEVFKGDAEVGQSDVKQVPASMPMNSIAVHDVRDLVAKAMAKPATYAEAVQGLFDVVQASVDAAGWENAGGSRGLLRVFADLLIVRNLPEHLRGVEKAIAELRAPPAAASPEPPPSPEEQAAEQAQSDAKARASLAKLQRIDRLRRVIDQRLWPATIHASAEAPIATATSVLLLVRDARDAAAIERLKTLGVRIDDINAAQNVIAGQADDARKLIDVASLEFVLRIEPLEP